LKALKQWASTIITDAILIASAYYWLIDKVEGAGNVFIFIVWFFIVANLIFGFTVDRTWFEKNPTAPGIRAHCYIAKLLIIGLLAWIGYFWTAGFYLFGSLLYEAAHTKGPKTEATQ
jgi:hypothetical protein